MLLTERWAAPGFQSWGGPGLVVVDLPLLSFSLSPIQKSSYLREFCGLFSWEARGSRVRTPEPPIRRCPCRM